MYLTFFGLNEKPFSITPDPRYLFLSGQHAEAMAHLLYGINEAGGFIQLTGEVGTGKTTIVRSLLARAPENAEIALILNPRMTSPEFLLTLCEELGIGVPDSAERSLKDLVDILSGYLLRAHAAGRRVVLVVDEAQNLSPEVLEQVRLLTNLETNTRKLLQIILIGQPELRELLSRNELRQLAQRITGRYHLAPLSEPETAAYVRHRLRVAGATTEIFGRFALREVHRLSGGVPRVINVICDRALLGGYSLDRHRITTALVRQAAAEVFGRRFPPGWLPWAAGVALLVLLSAGGAALWRLAPGWLDVAARTQPLTTAPARDPGRTVPGAPTGRGAAVHARHAGSLPALLARYAADATADAAYTRLFSLWGLRYAPGTDPCVQASRHGLACLQGRGSLGALRLYNRPAILLLTDSMGIRRRVVLTRLGKSRATVDFGRSAHQVGIGELSREWLGDYFVLWRPGAGPVQSLSAGMRGANVLWLRRGLRELAGGNASAARPASDVYDSRLARLVRRFQRTHHLTANGVAGIGTQAALSGAIAAPGTPLLTSADHGS
jgi:general secretion pathway protein A